MSSKSKIIEWLNEELFAPEEKADPNAEFNISIKTAQMRCNIVKDNVHKDNFRVIAKLSINPDLQKLIKSLGIDEKDNLLWELQLTLTKNNELGDFKIKPNPPEDMQEIYIASESIYFDPLVKSTLIHRINVVNKAIFTVIWTMEKFVGVRGVQKFP